MNRKTLGVLGAVVLALVGTVAIVLYVKDAEKRAVAGEELVPVYVVGDNIAAGSGSATVEQAITIKQVPKKIVPDNAVTSLDQIAGQVADVELVAGEQLLLNRFVAEATFERDRPGLVEVPNDLHEVTISLAPERAVGGEISPGDTVGVFFSFEPTAAFPYEPGSGPRPWDPNGYTDPTTHLTLHKILVTRVQVEQLPQQNVGPDGDDQRFTSGDLAPTGNLLVTLAVSATQAEPLIHSAEFGTIWLSYEPDDASEEGTTRVTPITVFDSITTTTTLQSDVPIADGAES